MAWMDGAVRREITKHRTPIVGPDRLIFHTAVPGGDTLYYYFQSVTSCSHWYVKKDGGLEQYVDTRFQAPAQRQGNYDCLSVETYDGYGTDWHDGDPVPPWNDAQMDTNVDIAVFAHLTHGIPLELLPDSKRGRRGVGYHRLGIDPWRVSGGERWSNPGKICPGPARIAQVPEIIERAKERVVAFTADEEKMLKSIVEIIKSKGSNAGLFDPLIDAIREGILTKENHGHGPVEGGGNLKRGDKVTLT